MSATPDPDWFAFVREGDVLQHGSHGAYRVVREVTRWTRRSRKEGGLLRGEGPLRAVVFTIQRRSWTGRPDTVYNAADLKTLGFRYVGARVRLASELDERFRDYLRRNPSRRDYLRRNPSRAEGYGLTPEDVRGVA